MYIYQDSLAFIVTRESIQQMLSILFLHLKVESLQDIIQGIYFDLIVILSLCIFLHLFYEIFPFTAKFCVDFQKVRICDIRIDLDVQLTKVFPLFGGLPTLQVFASIDLQHRRYILSKIK
jgi:hypothetical protein